MAMAMAGMVMAISSQAVTPIGTTRSRTLLFLSYRDSTARTSRSRRNPFLPRNDTFDEDTGDEHQRLISHTDNDSQGHVALDVTLPPKWVDISDQVHDILASTQQKISVLERLHSKHVLPGFADRSAEEREIEAVTTDITRDFRRCQSLIQSIPASTSQTTQPDRHTFPPRQAAPQTLSRHEKLAAQNVQRALAAKVQELSATFRKKQRVYLDTLQGHAIKNQDLLVASGALTLKGSEGMSDVDEDMRIASQNQSSSLYTQQAQSQAQAQAQEDIDSTILTRTREISEIAKSIGALAELFKDLQTLVIDQGTLLDSIEYNIEQTAVDMQEAVTELKIAEGYQRNTGRRKCIFLLLLICFGLVVVLIFKPRRHAVMTDPGATTQDSSASAAGGKTEGLRPIPVDVTPLNPELIGGRRQTPDNINSNTQKRSNTDSDSNSESNADDSDSDSDVILRQFRFRFAQVDSESDNGLDWGLRDLSTPNPPAHPIPRSGPETRLESESQAQAQAQAQVRPPRRRRRWIQARTPRVRGAYGYG